MEGSITPRKLAEPKLHDWVFNKYHSEYVTDHHAADNIPEIRTYDESDIKKQAVQILQRTPIQCADFKEPTVSYLGYNSFSPNLRKSVQKREFPSNLSNDFVGNAESLYSSRQPVTHKKSLNANVDMNATIKLSMPEHSLTSAGVTQTVVYDGGNPCSIPYLAKEENLTRSTQANMSTSDKCFSQPTYKQMSLRKNRKTIEEKSDLLAKLKETIRKQKESRSPVNVKNPTHLRKDIQNSNFDGLGMCVLNSEQTILRKIAVGPAAPTYMGFNKPEVRLRATDGKVWKASEFNNNSLESQKVLETRGVASGIGGARIGYGKRFSRNFTFSKSQPKKKTTRKTGKILCKNSPCKKCSITPSSWRDGQKIANAVLNASKKHNTDKTERSSTTVEDTKETSFVTGTLKNEHVTHFAKNYATTNGNEANDEEKKGFGKYKELYSEETKAVLDDLLTSSSDSNVDETQIASLIVKKKEFKPTPFKETKAENKKIRHYDPMQIQLYMAKQKADRKRKQAELRRNKKETHEKIVKKLIDLDQRQKEARKKVVKPSFGGKKSMNETYTRELQDTFFPVKCEGYEKRIPALMDKLDAQQGRFCESGSTGFADQLHQEKEVSPFLLKLDQCLQEPIVSHVASEVTTISNLNVTGLSDTLKKVENPKEPSTSAYSDNINEEFQQKKLNRIAHLRAKSEALQERIALRSKQLLDQHYISSFQEERLPGIENLGAFSAEVDFITDNSDLKMQQESNEPLLPYRKAREYLEKTPALDVALEHFNQVDDQKHAGEHSGMIDTEESHANSLLDDSLSMQNVNANGNSELDFLQGMLLQDRVTSPPQNENLVLGNHIRDPTCPQTIENNELLQSPWKRSVGDKYSVVNLFTQKYIKSVRPQEKEENQDCDVTEDAVINQKPLHGYDINLLRGDYNQANESFASSFKTFPHDNDVIPDNFSPKAVKARNEDLVEYSERNSTNSSCETSFVDEKFCWDKTAEPINLQTVQRFSPAVLQYKMALELNRYETIDEQLKQLEGSERTQGIAMAQQETVSLAEVLKSRQLQHELEMERLTFKAKEETLEASQKATYFKKDLSNDHTNRGYYVDTKLKQEKTLPPEKLSAITAITSRSTEAKQLQDSPRHSEHDPTKSGLISSSFSSISEDILATETSATKETSFSKDLSEKGAHNFKPMNTNDNPSLPFDEILTEDEIMEISQRALIPSESYRRKQLKKASSVISSNLTLERSDMSLSSDDTLPNYSKDQSKSKVVSLFGDSDFSSFSRFMNDHVKQYMLEQQVRSQHQAAMLKLREKAIKEKTQMELAWLELKKRHIRNKGEDDKMPPIKKKKRAILLRLQVETEEIKKLQAANKAASQDRELMLQQQQDINRIMLTTQHLKDKLKFQDGNDLTSKPSTANVQPRISLAACESDDMSESEININNSMTNRLMTRLKKSMGGLDDRKLTTREKVLLKRKKEAERLIEWKRKLDKEEERVFVMEQKALTAWNSKDADMNSNKAGSQDQVESMFSSSIHSLIKEDISVQDAIEDSLSSSRQSATRTQDLSSEDTLGDEYSQNLSMKEDDDGLMFKEKDLSLHAKNNDWNEAKDSIKPIAPSPDLRTPLLARFKPISDGVAGLKRRESSENWSDESFSQTQSETEQSDVECRVHALKEELKRRRLIADHLKRQQKKKHKEHLRAQEASLKSQIEAYDAFIKSTQQEINLGLDSSHYGSFPTVVAKPQIRSPRKNDQNHHANRPLRTSGTTLHSPDASPRAGSQKSITNSLINKQRSDSESSGRSSRSLTFDEEHNSPEEATTPNGTSLPLWQTLPSRHHDKNLVLVPDVQHQDCPSKLEIIASKPIRSMIPVPVPSRNASSSHVQSLVDQNTIISDSTVSLQEKPGTKDCKVISPPSNYSDDFEKGSVATEDGIGEQFSEILSDKSEASALMLRLTKESSSDKTDDDKTPIPSPLITSSTTPLAATSDQSYIIARKYDEPSGKDVSDGTHINSEVTSKCDNILKVMPLHTDRKDETPMPSRKHKKVADVLSSKLLYSLVEESIDSAVKTHKLSEALSPQFSTAVEEGRQKHTTYEKTNQVSESLTKDLLDDTISMAVVIRKDRKRKWQTTEDTDELPSKDLENISELENIVRNAGESEEVEPVFLRPVSPVFGTSQDTEEWFDDDFGLSNYHSKIVSDSTPTHNLWTYTGGEDHSYKESLEEPVKSTVSCKPVEVLEFIDKIFAFCYVKHCNKDLYPDEEMPSIVCDAVYSENNPKPDITDSNSNAFKRSIFDLVRDLLLQIYSADKKSPEIWHKAKRKRSPKLCHSVPSTKAEALRAIRNEISCLYNFPEFKKKKELRHFMKWGNLKKKDNVDLLLIEEMREEEPSWTDYDVDETSVKMQLTDTIFDMLINDTIAYLCRVETRKLTRRSYDMS